MMDPSSECTNDPEWVHVLVRAKGGKVLVKATEEQALALCALEPDRVEGVLENYETISFGCSAGCVLLDGPGEVRDYLEEDPNDPWHMAALAAKEFYEETGEWDDESEEEE